MPLSEPASRKRLHHRAIALEGFQRDDGLFDIEGRLVDTKDHGFDNDWRGRLEPGTPIHDMWLRLTLDADYVVRAIEAVIDASPFEICPVVTANFQRLVGVRVGEGWRRAVRERVGGVAGCTHLVELLGPIGTVAFQTMATLRRGVPTGGLASDGRPRLIDSCHALRADGPVVAKRWPEHHVAATDAKIPR